MKSITSPVPFSRRRFLQGGGLAALMLGAGQVKAEHTGAPRLEPAFPADFMWGASTAAYQVEGACDADGRAPSIWDRFCRIPGRIANNDTGDRACDHYHRFGEDIRLMAELGVRHYRLSLSWSRILPSGRGTVNRPGLDFYERVVDSLLAHGITPHVTLYHWDLPQALQDEYRGWEDDRVIGDLGAFATLAARTLGDRVHSWMTLNEIQSFAARSGYAVGRPGKTAPGIQLADKKQHRQLVHRVLKAHGQACLALRAASPGPCRIGFAENHSAMVPIIETPEHVAAASRAFLADEFNAAILVPMLTGRYRDDWLTACAGSAPEFSDADMRLIAQPVDYLGFNCYSGNYVKAADNAGGFERIEIPANYQQMNLNWLKLIPEGIYWGVRQLSECLPGTRLPILITENGAPDCNAAGDLVDIARIQYLRAHLGNVLRARQEGYPVIGYFPWSLLDNFEWVEGYAKRFGLVHVDFTTQRRTPKASFHWYREVIRTGRLA